MATTLIHIPNFFFFSVLFSTWWLRYILSLWSLTGADKSRVGVCGSFRSPALHPGAWVHGALGSQRAALRLAQLPVLRKALATPSQNLDLAPGQNLGEGQGLSFEAEFSNLMRMTIAVKWMLIYFCPHRSHSHRGSRRHYSRSRSRSRSRSYRRRSHSRSYSGEHRRRSHSRSPMSNRRRHIGNRVSAQMWLVIQDEIF